MASKDVEWFVAPGNLVWAVASVVFGLGVTVVTLIEADDAIWPLAGLLFALLAYASMWRPRIGASSDTLLLRAMYSTQMIPLAAIDSVVISRTFAAHVIGRNYVSSAIGRGLRESVVGKRRPKGAETVKMGYADIVETRLTALVENARARTGVQRGSEAQGALAAQVRRTWAWPEMALSIVVTIALIVAVLM